MFLITGSDGFGASGERLDAADAAYRHTRFHERGEESEQQGVKRLLGERLFARQPERRR